MDLLSTARAELAPLIDAVLDALSEDDPAPLVFFTLMRRNLEALANEGDLQALFFELSTTAFQGFTFDASQAAAIDRLLAACQDIAHTLSAPSADPH